MAPERPGGQDRRGVRPTLTAAVTDHPHVRTRLGGGVEGDIVATQDWNVTTNVSSASSVETERGMPSREELLIREVGNAPW